MSTKDNLRTSPRQVARALGYNVIVDDESGTAMINGFGIATMFDPSDDTLIASVIGGHAERSAQFLAQAPEIIADAQAQLAANPPPIAPT